MAVKGHSFGAVYPVYIILDILSEVSEKKTASENDENYRLQQPHCLLTSSSRGIPANIRIYLIFLETRIIGLHSAADSMNLSSLKLLWWAP